jgi:NADPH-dependent curcumin reductase CurA
MELLRLPGGVQFAKTEASGVNMLTLENHAIVLVKRPQGTPTEDCFALMQVQAPEVQSGQAKLKTLYLSVDPYMRARMNETAHSGRKPFEIGKPLSGGVVAEVVESKSPAFAVGDVVLGMLPWEEYSVADAKSLQKVNTYGQPLSLALGSLGMPGLTAYFGLLDIGQPKAGETVVVSGAAGAVGNVVGQIAKIKGCRVVGIAGTDAKIDFLKKELGFDAAINYRKASDLSKAVADACPDGVNIYFDNVGGAISDAVLLHLAEHARIPVCGQISLYNLEKPELGPRVQPLMLRFHALMKGFLQSEYSDRFGEALPQLAAWIKEGKLKNVESVAEGLASTPAAFIGLFHGKNLGKQVVKVA